MQKKTKGKLRAGVFVFASAAALFLAILSRSWLAIAFACSGLTAFVCAARLTSREGKRIGAAICLFCGKPWPHDHEGQEEAVAEWNKRRAEIRVAPCFQGDDSDPLPRIPLELPLPRGVVAPRDGGAA